MVTKEEKQIIEQILEYCETGKTSMTNEIMHNPVSNYNDPKKLNAEINTLFREFPIIVAHVSELSEPGKFITHNDTGCLLYTSPSPRDATLSRMPSSA